MKFIQKLKLTRAKILYDIECLNKVNHYRWQKELAEGTIKDLTKTIKEHEQH